MLLVLLLAEESMVYKLNVIIVLLDNINLMTTVVMSMCVAILYSY